MSVHNKLLGTEQTNARLSFALYAHPRQDQESITSSRVVIGTGNLVCIPLCDALWCTIPVATSTH